MKKEYVVAIVVGVIGVIAYLIYKSGKKAGGIIKYPNNGQGIPVGWSPRASVVRLQGAFNPSGSAWLQDVDGTTEEEIFNTLTGLTDDQLAAVYNDYQQLTSANLLDRFRAELSGDELTRALAFFSFISTRFTNENLRYNLKIAA